MELFENMLAAGQPLTTLDLLSIVARLFGAALLGGVVVLLRMLELTHRTNGSATAEVRIVLSPTDTDRSVYEVVLARFASDWTVLTALLEQPQILRANYAADEDNP